MVAKYSALMIVGLTGVALCQCQGDEPACLTGETEWCYCNNGARSVRACDANNSWTPCDCPCDGEYCGNNTCNAVCGEDNTNCLQDCPCAVSCVGRECGMDPDCNVSCGSCDDGNPCTTDTCSAAGLCEYSNIEFESLACVDDFYVSYCQDGQELQASCAPICVDDQGANALAGCANATCQCVDFNVPGECTPDEKRCTTDGSIMLCFDGPTYGTGQNFWLVGNCQEVCENDGWDITTGCDYDTTGEAWCYCDDAPCVPDCTNRACGTDPICGLPCGNTNNCSSLSGGYHCVEDSNGAYCECNPSCQPYGSSVCCGGSLCAGDCIGNPCC